MRSFAFILALPFIIFSCKKESTDVTVVPENAEQIIVVPPGFPEPAFPDDNTFSYERWSLGKKLFFDPVLSDDGLVSCASCHAPELAFSDDVAFSPGSENAPGTRNAPSLANVVYHPYFTREGGVPTLEMQVLVPIQEHNEFNSNILEIAERISQNETYVQMSQEAYGRNPDAFVITRAIANFERSLISGNSAYDQAVYQNISGAMSPAEIRGKDLFFSTRTNCSACHSGVNFSNYAFENNGLYDEYPDPGRYRLTGDSADLAKFKVPSLRNVAMTAPYMHDGSIETLEGVVEHYISGGSNHINKSALIQPLDLTEQEKQDLIAFLSALTDYSFCQNPLFRP